MTHQPDRKFQPWQIFDNLLRDFRFSIRQIVKRPAFALFVVLTLAVGIGPNVAIFSVLKALILQPFYYPEPDRLVQVWQTDIAGRWHQPFTSPDYFDIKEQSTVFQEFGVYSTQVFNLSDGEPVRVQGVAGTASVLNAYGVMPAMGRLFTEEEEQEGKDRVVVLSSSLWSGRFGADAQIIGRRIRINSEEHEIIGVMPEEFQFSSPWFRGRGFEIWKPIVLSREEQQRGSHWLLAIGRLKDDVDWRSAETEIRAIAAQLAEAHPKTNARTQVWIMPFAFEIVGQFIGQLLILCFTVGFVLLVACANVASILLAKGAGRQTEMAVRISLGAGRRRIISQLLSESFLLAVLGGIAGVLLAYWSLDLLRSLIPPNLQGGEAIRIDRTVLIFTFGLSIFTALLFGFVPALTASRTHLVDALKEGSGSRTAAKTRNRILRILAVAQIALALLLTNGAILLFKSYRNVLNLPQGFDTREVLTGEIWLWGPRYEEDQAKAAFWEQLIERIESLPGVEQAAVTSKLPLEGGTNGSVLVDGEVYDPQVMRPLVEQSYVSADYFEAIGIPFLAGRSLNQADETSSEKGVVVNRALVDRYWPGENAIGRRIRSNSDPPGWEVFVVGVVDNVRQWSSIHRPLPEMYVPYGARPRVRAKLIVRTQVDARTLLPVIRQEVSRLDPDLPIADIRTMEDVFSTSTRGRRFLTLLLDLFTAFALILSITGIYGFVSYHVAQRTHEIGIRVALGATRKNLLVMVLKNALILVTIGIAVGLAMTVNASFIAGSLVYGISPLNPLYISGGVLFVILVAMLASCIPALRGSRIDPVQALRIE
jgi:predicted permease